MTAARLPRPPVALALVGDVLNLAQLMTFVVMLLAAVRIGPWACRYEASEEVAPGPGRSDDAGRA